MSEPLCLVHLAVFAADLGSASAAPSSVSNCPSPSVSSVGSKSFPVAVAGGGGVAARHSVGTAPAGRGGGGVAAAPPTAAAAALAAPAAAAPAAATTAPTAPAAPATTSTAPPTGGAAGSATAGQPHPTRGKATPQNKESHPTQGAEGGGARHTRRSRRPRPPTAHQRRECTEGRTGSIGSEKGGRGGGGQGGHNRVRRGCRSRGQRRGGGGEGCRDSSEGRGRGRASAGTHRHCVARRPFRWEWVAHQSRHTLAAKTISKLSQCASRQVSRLSLFEHGAKVLTWLDIVCLTKINYRLGLGLCRLADGGSPLSRAAHSRIGGRGPHAPRPPPL